ncbi:Gfo/Idh/MocA family oxidoreductase [soil metagenome]
MRHRTNRRDFFKQTALAGAGLWVVGSGSHLLARSANDKLNIGIIGTGGRGGGNIDGVKEENIVALCDIDQDRLGQAGNRFPEAKTFQDFRKLLEECDNLDAVVISTPDHTHAVAAAMALKMGKHVYCEKPLTHSIHEARVLKKLAAEAGVATQMGNQGHSNPGAARTVEIIRSGAIGPVKEVHAWTNRPIWPQGVESIETRPAPDKIAWDLWLGPAPEAEYSPDLHPFKWRGFWDYGTGALGDMACHILDVAFWACDLRDPSSVEVVKADKMTDISPPSRSVLRYQFPEREGRPALTFTWYDGGELPPEDLVEGEELRSGGSLIVGEKGKIYIPDDYGSRYVLLPKKDFEGYEPPEESIPRSPGHHRDWIEACKGRDRPAGSNFDYACDLTETVLLGNVALLAGGKVDWDAENARIKNGSTENRYVQREYRQGWSL